MSREAGHITFKDFYKDLCKTHPEFKGTVNRQKVKKIVYTHNGYVMDKIMDGFYYHIGDCVGTIMLKKRKRNDDLKLLNYGATNKLKAELLAEGADLVSKTNPTGVDYRVFYTDPYYYEFCWLKSKSYTKETAIPNSINFHFKAAKAVREVFVKKTKEDPLFALKFKVSGFKKYDREKHQ